MPRAFTEQQSEAIGRSRNTANARNIEAIDRKLLILLLLMKKEASQRILQGQYPIPLDYQTRWSNELEAGQTTEGRSAANQGYASAAVLLSQLGRESGVVEQEQSMFAIHQEKISEYFKENSKRQANTVARKMRTVLSKETAILEENKLKISDAILAEAFLKGMGEFDRTYATMAARTGVIWANNEGVLTKYKEGRVVNVRWYTMLDERVCPFCASLHDTVVGTGTAFAQANSEIIAQKENAEGKMVEVKLKIPEWSIFHPPLHTHCRCILLPEF